MNVEFTPEQLALRDSVRSLLTAQAAPATAKTQITNQNASGPQIWWCSL